MGYTIHEDTAEDLEGKPLPWWRRGHLATPETECTCAPPDGPPTGYLCGKRTCWRTIECERDLNSQLGLAKYIRALWKDL